MVKNAKKHTYDGIDFRSSLEVYCYKQLKKEGFDFEYEGGKIELIPSFVFQGMWIESNKNGVFCEAKQDSLPKRYTPDFSSKNNDWIIETKGWQQADNWTVKRKLIRYFLKDKNIKFFVPRTQKDVDQVILILKGKLEPLPFQVKKRATKK